MGKGTNFSGQPVLSQLIKLMDRQKINTLASKSGANYYTKHLDGYSHLVVMLYAVLSNLRSLRETCLIARVTTCQYQKKLSHGDRHGVTLRQVRQVIQ